MKNSVVIQVDGEGRFELYQLNGLVDISRVKFYSFKVDKNGKLVLKLYDKKRKLVRPYESK